MYNIFLCLGICHAAMAACPYMDSSYAPQEHGTGTEKVAGARRVVPRDLTSTTQSTEDFLDQFTLNDTNVFLTSDAGGPIADQDSLKAGERGPTLLEDFIFRQKIQHFDHERVSQIRPGIRPSFIGWLVQNAVRLTSCAYLQVPERAVHARGAGISSALALQLINSWM
jgi:Catalase